MIARIDEPLTWRILSQCFLDQMPGNQPVISVFENLESIRGKDLHIGDFALEDLAKILEIELARQVLSATHFSIYEEQLSHNVLFSRLGALAKRRLRSYSAVGRYRAFLAGENPLRGVFELNSGMMANSAE